MSSSERSSIECSVGKDLRPYVGASTLDRETPGRSTSAKEPLPLGGASKRTLDIALILLVLPFLGLLMLGLALLIKQRDKGPMLYGHRRIGFDGREFNC